MNRLSLSCTFIRVFLSRIHSSHYIDQKGTLRKRPASPEHLKVLKIGWVPVQAIATWHRYTHPRTHAPEAPALLGFVARSQPIPHLDHCRLIALKSLLLLPSPSPSPSPSPALSSSSSPFFDFPLLNARGRSPTFRLYQNLSKPIRIYPPSDSAE